MSDGLLFGDAPDQADDWDGIAAEAPVDDGALYLELDGWEGPLDLLLDLARRQKVDLRQISILALVDQYLGYIERAEALRLAIHFSPMNIALTNIATVRNRKPMIVVGTSVLKTLRTSSE